jgi:hypothetical protein
MADIQTIGLNDDTYRGFRLGQSQIRFSRVHRALPARFDPWFQGWCRADWKQPKHQFSRDIARVSG